MPPEEPAREKVMVAVTDTLATIVAGATYWTTPALVTRTLLAIDQYATLLETTGPVLGVMRASGSLIQFDERPRTTKMHHHMRFAIWGYVRHSPTVLAGTWLERLWSDVATSLLSNPSLGLGSLVMELRPDGPTDTDDGALEPFAFFAQDWLARIRE